MILLRGAECCIVDGRVEGAARAEVLHLSWRRLALCVPHFCSDETGLRVDKPFSTCCKCGSKTYANAAKSEWWCAQPGDNKAQHINLHLCSA